MKSFVSGRQGRMVGRVGAWFAAAALLLGACNTKVEEVAGAACKGGFTRELPDGSTSCEPKCDPAACKPGNVCVNNQCRLQCDAHFDCAWGVQHCQAAVTDLPERAGTAEEPGGEAVTVCLENGHRPALPYGGYAALCALGDADCAQFACPSGLECDPQMPADCALDESYCFFIKQATGIEECNFGLTAGGVPCTFNTCDAASCRQLSCITSGEGDARSYCTNNDCQGDADCSPGFYCGNTRDEHDICGNSCAGGKCSHDASLGCKEDKDCQKGNNNFCGLTLEPCIDPSAFNASGATYFESALCLMRKTCLRRDICAPCASDLDCSSGNGDACVEHEGEKLCARTCADDTHCLGDEKCEDKGGVSYCVPRSGSCRATNAPGSKFCYHCLDDADCGDDLACGDFGGQRACFDPRFSTPCQTDADCPKSPSGDPGNCLDEELGVQPTNAVYHHCYLPYSKEKGVSCWQSTN